MLRKRYRGIIGGGDHNAFEQIGNAHFLSGFEINLRAAHTAGVVADGNGVSERYFSVVDRFQHQQNRHDFCYGCRGKSSIGVSLIQDFFAGCLH